ncbi:MAG: hypothetical protein H6Q74_338 [Firmicutes bacterium]|nr:hypothetical protein [Bacillota bacterium]
MMVVVIMVIGISVTLHKWICTVVVSVIFAESRDVASGGGGGFASMVK